MPLLESLQRMLNCKVVCDHVCKCNFALAMYVRNLVYQVFKNNSSTDGKLRNYSDGTAFKNHVLFQSDPYAFQLHLYYDDLEVYM